MDWADAGRAAYILHTIFKMIEGSTFEARLAALEQAADAEREPGRRPNGQAARPGYRQ